MPELDQQSATAITPDELTTVVDAAPSPRDDESPRAVGIQLTAVDAHVFAADENGETRLLHPAPQKQPTIPPAVLAPRFAGEPIRADLTWPPRPRGTGEAWPPEARVESGQPAGRFPLGYAWPMLSRAQTWDWTFEDRAVSVSPADAIAFVVATLIGARGGDPRKLLLAASRLSAGNGLSRRASHTAASRASHNRDTITKQGPAVGLLVPNSLADDAQQRLIDAADELHLDLHLLPRCVAAAHAWLDRFGDELDDDRSDRTKSFGRLLHVHFGLDTWEVATVDVMPRHRRGKTVWLPARTRYAPPPLPSYGVELMHRLAVRSLEMSYQVMTPARVWELVWCTPWMKTVLAQLSGHDGVGFPRIISLARHARRSEFLIQQCRQATQRIFRTGETVPALVRDVIGKSPEYTDIRDWFAARKRELAEEPLLGAIVTGPMALAPNEKQAVADHYLAKLWDEPKRVLVEGDNLSPDALPRAAARFAALMAPPQPLAALRDVPTDHSRSGHRDDSTAHSSPTAHDKPTAHPPSTTRIDSNLHSNTLAIAPPIPIQSHPAYLDPFYLQPLPRIRIAARVSGKPAWLDLFAFDGDHKSAAHEIVPGGVTHVRAEPLTGPPILPDKPQFKLAVHHEDWPTVRIAVARLPQVLHAPEPVTFHIAYRPGHGFPIIELLPAHRDLFGRHRVLVDFRELTDTGQTPEEFLRFMTRQREAVG